MEDVPLAELLAQIETLMPKISTPTFVDSVPQEQMRAAVAAGGLLVEASDAQVAAYRALHEAYNTLDIYYHHPTQIFYDK